MFVTPTSWREASEAPLTVKHKSHRGHFHRSSGPQTSSVTPVKTNPQDNNPLQLHTCSSQVDTGQSHDLKKECKYLLMLSQLLNTDLTTVRTQTVSSQTPVKSKVQSCVIEWDTAAEPPRNNYHLRLTYSARKINFFLINKTFQKELAEGTPQGPIPQATAILDLGKYNFC